MAGDASDVADSHAGASGKVKLITFDSSDSHVEALADGTITMMIVQDPFKIGYEAVKSLAVKLNGGTPEKRIRLDLVEAPARCLPGGILAKLNDVRS